MGAKRHDGMKDGRILIIKLSALGDIVQSLPVLWSIKKTWPSCKVDWITGETGLGLLRGHSLLDRVMLYPRKRLGKLARNPFRWPRLFKHLSDLSREIKRYRYLAVLDLQGLFKSGLITFMSLSDKKVGFAGGREASSLFLNHRLPAYDPDEHAVSRYLKIAGYIGAETDEIRFPVDISKDEIMDAEAFLKGLGAESKRYVLLIPGTIWPTKRWTPEGFSRLAEMMAGELGLKSLVAGSTAESRLGSVIERLSRGAAIDITGRTSIKRLAALSRLAKTAVATDTGPMHLASASGLRLVALFGPTAPWRTGPFGHEHIIIRKDIECSPCFRRSCSSMRCMLSITPEEVFRAVKRLANSSC